MKKQVVKTMSVGLSAITLASSMSVTAFAEELPEAPATTETEVVEEAPTKADTAKAEAEKIVEEIQTASDNFSGELTDVNSAANDTTSVTGAKTIKTEFADNKNLSDARAAVAEADKALETATDKETTEAIIDAAENAGEAEDEVDSLINGAGTKANDAKEAAENVVIITDNAKTVVETGSKADAITIIADASTSVEKAEEKYEDAKTELGKVELNYFDALNTYNNAVEYLNSCVETESANLAEAQRQVKLAEEALNALKKDVKDAKNNYLTATAGAIVGADNNEDYIKAIMKYYYLPQAASDVKVIYDYNNGNKDDSNFFVTYNLGNREVTEKFAYTYNWKTEEVQIVKCEKRYEFTDSEGKAQSITEKELNDKLSNGTAVARYKVDNKYYTADELKAKNLTAADASEVAYIMIKSAKEDQIKAEGFDAVCKDEKGRTIAEEVLATTDMEGVAYFDENGNYCKKYTDATTKKTYTYVNGVLTLVNDTNVQSSLDAEKTAKDFVEIVAGEKYWTASGYYVPVYKWSETVKEGWGWFSSEKTITHEEAVKTEHEFVTAEIFGFGEHTKNEKRNEYGKRADVFDIDVKDRDGKIASAIIKFYQGYAIASGIAEDTLEDALKKITEQAINNIDARAINDKRVEFELWPLGFYVNDKTYYREVIGYDPTKGSIVTNYIVNYTGKQESSSVADEGYRYNSTDSVASESAFRQAGALFSDASDGFKTYVNTLKARKEAYKTLEAKVAEAEQNLSTAKSKLQTIQNNLNALKVSEAENVANLALWNGLYEAAKQNVGNAEANLETANRNLSDAKKAFARKYPAPVAGGSDDSSSYRAVVTPVVEAETAVIADAAVPTAAPTRARRAAAVATTTIEDEQTPLAGDTTETVEAEDSKDEVATIADEKAPLAAAAPKSLFAKTWWAWLLLAIALIGGAVAYSKKRVEDKLNK